MKSPPGAPYPFTLRQLQYLVAVAEAQSFRRAAERCHVAQPSLSAQIAALEGALGVRLFERGRRRVLVTPAGAAVLGRARILLLGAQDLAEEARRHVDPLTGTLRIGVIPTIGPYLLPEIDPAIRAAYPKLTLTWTEEKTDVLVERIDAGTLDAAFLARVGGLEPLEQEEIGEDPFVLAAAKQHPLARRSGPVRLDALKHEDVLLLTEGHCFGDQALALCSAAGATELGFRATSLSTLVQMAAGNAGVTLLPAMAVEVENRRGALAIRPFARPVPSRTVVLVWRRQSPLGDALRAVAATARNAFAASRSGSSRKAL